MEGAPEPSSAGAPKATLSVADCLSCSGCVTSTESILVNAQSTPALLVMLSPPTDEPPYEIYITLSPQTITDVAVHASRFLKQPTSPPLIKALLHSALLSLPRAAHMPPLTILDDTPADVHRSLISSMAKDLSYRLTADPLTAAPHYSTTHYSVPLSRDEMTIIPLPSSEPPTTLSPTQLPPTPTLPMLSTHCPGVVCYIEKTIPTLIPHLTRTIPGMSVTSLLLKSRVPSCKVVSVQMCHDKKLEATRKDYKGSWGNATDLVLTTNEVWELVKDRLVQLDVTTLAPLEHAPELAPHAASAGSGSLADTLFRIMLHKHFGISDYLEQVNQPLPWDVDSRNSRRKDPQGIKEVLLVTRAGKKHVVGPNELEGADSVELRFAIAAGFKNLTILQQKMPTKQYHFVELSACPSGCLNGGGNIPPALEEGGGKKESLVQARARVDLARAVHCWSAASGLGWGGEWVASSGFKDSVDRIVSMGLPGGEEWGLTQAWHRVKPLELSMGNLEGVKKDDIGW